MGNEENAFGELIQDYIVECLPLAERAGDAFLELEQRWKNGEAGEELLAMVKGTLHTVKGNSAMMGLVPMQEVAHALEDVCALLGRDATARDGDTASLLIEGSGLLADLIRSAAEGGDGKAARSFVARVQTFAARADSISSEEGPPEQRRGERRTADRREGGGEASSAVVRVDFRRLDTLLEVLGEGMIEHAAVVEAFRQLARGVGPSQVLGDLDLAILALQKTMRRLEAVVMETRLLPISSVFRRFPRLVRELAQEGRKQVRLVTSGGETLLDKAVLDRLSEPLIHLLSNAIVHGIEVEEERAQAGKPAEAVIELRTSSESGRVVIHLSDDGRGLDEKKILAKAQAQDLNTEEIGAARLHSLIFLPGFSTAEEVSPLAGRGVGLDVVATSIHSLGGTIRVESQPGRGVTFILDLPLTLAVIRSLIVEVDEERYAVPISHVAESVRAGSDDIHEINRRGVALWRGDLIHVADGGTLLGTTGRSDTPRRFFVVISSGGKRRGVLVDRLLGHQDIVVKGLDPTLGRPGLVFGTTILGDGKVACILDAVRILDQRPAEEPTVRRRNSA
jgi:two-component system, chemotaxis family, sensor kinase CheA